MEILKENFTAVESDTLKLIKSSNYEEVKFSPNFRTNPDYLLLEEKVINGRQYEIYRSLSDEDSYWDEFVSGVSDSCVHQLSGWVGVKQLEGWDYLRIIYVQDNKIVAGYQILIKKFPLIGKAGYLNHTPVTNNNDESFIKILVSDLKLILKNHKIILALINPPLIPQNLSAELSSEFGSTPSTGLINAEAEIDLTIDEQILFKNLLRMRRQNIRKSEHYKFEITEGSENDLEKFFILMSESCKRNNVKPNPPSLESIKKIWDYYHSSKKIMNLYNFYINNELVSAILAFEFQDTFTPWKFGWSGAKSSYKPNDVFHWELIKLAKKKGYKKYNLGGINTLTAQRFINHERLNESEIKSATFFKMGFGCYIKRLPTSVIYFSNFLYKIFYKLYLIISKLKFF